MNPFLGAGGPFLLAALQRLHAEFSIAGPADLLWSALRTIEEATGFGSGTVTAFGAGGTLLLVVVALAVIRRVASLVVSFAILAGLLAWWAGWIF